MFGSCVRYSSTSTINTHSRTFKAGNAPWISDKSPTGYWDEFTNHRVYFDWLADQLSIGTVDEWYDLKKEQIMRNGGGGLLSLVYSGSSVKSLMTVFPDTTWQPWRFERVPDGFWYKLENQEMYFEWLAQEMNIISMSGWYDVKDTNIYERAGGRLLHHHYKDSLYSALQTVYPHYLFLPWLFQAKVPNEWWNLLKNQRMYLDWLSKEMSIVDTSGWYRVKPSDILKKKGGRDFMNAIQGNPARAIAAAYPQVEWHPWIFNQACGQFWRETKNQRRFMDWVSEMLKVKHLEDWYILKPTDLLEIGGTGLVDYYGGSVKAILKSVYPQTSWHQWLFEQTSQYWGDPSNQRQYLEWLSGEFEIDNQQDWYSQLKTFMAHTGGEGLLQQFGGSLVQLLKSVFPNAEWHPWISDVNADSIWENTKIQRKFFDWIAESFRINLIEDWYRISKHDVVKLRGEALLSYYGNVLSEALAAVYPFTDWHFWEFDDAPAGFWEDLNNHRLYLTWLMGELGIEKSEDWYQIKASDILRRGGGKFLSFYEGSPSKALKTLYPDIEWHPWLFSQAPQQHWESEKHQRQFCDWLAEQLSISLPSDWYQVKKQHVIDRGGLKLLHIHNNSLYRVLSKNYPFSTWEPWLFANIAAQGFLEDPANQKRYMDWFARQLHISHPDGWYSTTNAMLIERGGGDLLGLYGGSIARALQSIYPQTPWQVSKFPEGAQGFWDDKQNQQLYYEWAELQNNIGNDGQNPPWFFEGNHTDHKFWDNIKYQRQYFDWLGKQLHILSPEDWHHVKKISLIERGAGPLLDQYYGGSLIRAIQTVYPEIEWQPWRFSAVPQGFWDDQRNHSLFFSWLSEQLHIKKKSDWYRVRVADILKYGGSKLLNFYHGSAPEALKCVYPDEDWKPWLFEGTPLQFWQMEANQRIFFDWLAEEFEMSTTADWYSVKKGVIQDVGGSGLLEFYGENTTMSELLSTVYPVTDWLIWRFNPLPKGFWDNMKNQREYLKWFEDQFEIDDPLEWYGITFEQVMAHYGSTLLAHEGGLMALVKQHYPNTNWQTKKRPTTSSKVQKYLFRTLNALWENVDVEYNLPHHFLGYSNSQKLMQLDIWVPQFNMCFEYQGKQHYFPHHFYGNMGQIHRDEEKRSVCKELGIALVRIPYWWDYRESSLAATIQRHCAGALRSEILDGIPIPDSVPWMTVDQNNIASLVAANLKGVST